MDIDMHYFGTYAAARLAGYDLGEATTIAHAAQYVDESTAATLLDDKGAYLVPDFKPHPTIQETSLDGEVSQAAFKPYMQSSATETGWSDAYLNHVRRVWASFHFLPANYGAQPPMAYSGPLSDGKWRYDDFAKTEFKMLCLPDGPLVGAMVNDTVDNHRGTDYLLHLAGLRMHVMADTYAHTYYAGTYSWCLNDVGGTVTEIHQDGSRKNIVWVPGGVGGETYAPAISGSYWGTPYLGHIRMGHVPDYPYIKYEYTPRWSSAPLVKDNPTFYLRAFRQITEALRCIRDGRRFDPTAIPALPADTEAKVVAVLAQRDGTPEKRCAAWRDALANQTFDGRVLGAPVEFDHQTWIAACKAKPAPERHSTDYYRFNKAAAAHVELVATTLYRDGGITLDEDVDCRRMTARFRASNGRYVGPMVEAAAPGTGNSQYFPVLSPQGLPFTLILERGKTTLDSGTRVKLVSPEPALAEYDSLGAWPTSKALYYYTANYEIPKQSWIVEKADGSGGTIRSGDKVRLRNIHFDQVMSWYKPTLYKDDYLTTVTSRPPESEWVIEF